MKNSIPSPNKVTSRGLRMFFFQPPTRVKTRGVGWLHIFPQESEFLQAYTEPAKFYWASTSGRFGCPPWLEENVSRPHEMGKTIGKPWENAELTMKNYDLINKNRDFTKSHGEVCSITMGCHRNIMRRMCVDYNKPFMWI